MGLIEFFSLPNRDSEVVQLFLANRQACRWKAKELRHKQFTETLGVAAIGRGNEAKIFIEDLEAFEKMDKEILVLEERVRGIEKLIASLDSIISKADSLLDSTLPTPGSFRIAASERLKQVYNEKQGLRDRAVKNMGYDTFQEATAEVENLSEVMAEDIKKTNRQIKVLEDEAAILNGLYNECHKLMESSRDLLIPAEEPEPEIVPPLYALEQHHSMTPQYVDDREAVEARNAAIRRGE